jgi:hypothetical protein
MNVHTMPIVVDPDALAKQRRSRVPAAAPADEYVRKLIPLRALAAPVDFRIGLPLLPVRRPSLH